MRVLVTGGGTAGHINPALAIADSIRREYPDTEFLFVGAEGKMETELVPKAGYPIKTVKVQGFKRSFAPKSILYNCKTVACVLSASRISADILKEFKPDIAIGTGGYVCGPILRKALKMRIPVLVHESNAFPGVTVKALAKEGATVLLCSEEARRHLPANCKCIVTGNPLRPAFATLHTPKAKAAARAELGLDERPLVLSFGGSLGARWSACWSAVVKKVNCNIFTAWEKAVGPPPVPHSKKKVYRSPPTASRCVNTSTICRVVWRRQI